MSMKVANRYYFAGVALQWHLRIDMLLRTAIKCHKKRKHIVRRYTITTMTTYRNGQGRTRVMGLDLDYPSKEINAYERGNLPML